jgi:putative selenium metabolism protein SsnA
MPGPKVQPANFLEILQKVWWKLDRALDDESIYYSALVGAVEAARCGTTTLVDHHASPSAIGGSLDIIKQAVEEAGLRGVLCYEVTDRGGKKERDQGLKENERFIRANRKHPRFRGMVGAHASFTLSNDSLRLCGDMASENKMGVHIHVAEDTCDSVDAEENYECSVVGRLSECGILRDKSILAHCIHVGVRDFLKLRESRCWLVHNPRSNMNNRVGHAPLRLFGDRACLGTDGFPADMLEEARVGFFWNQEERDKKKEARGGRISGISQSAKPITSFLQSNQEMVSEIFSQKFGTLEKGSVADLVVMEYESPSPLNGANLPGHFLFGMQSSMVESVMVGGKWVVQGREIVGQDVPSIYEKARNAAKKLWARI